MRSLAALQIVLAILCTPSPLIAAPAHHEPGSDDRPSSAAPRIADATPLPIHPPSAEDGMPIPNLVRKPYLQQGTDHSVIVAWRTDVPTAARVQYGPSPTELTQTVLNPTPATDHFVEITGLPTDSLFFYAVGTDTQTLAGGDANHYFRTSPATGVRTPFTVWVVGDSGTGGTAQANVRDAMLAVTAGDPPDLFVHVGDMAYSAGTDGQFTGKFFAPYAQILRHTVCWPAIGNHEGASSDSGTQSGPYYQSYTLPSGGEAGGLPTGTEAYYAFDYANVHFIALDSHDTDRSPGSAMLTWLAADLAATDQEWLIAFWHHPPYTKGTHDSDNVGDSGGRMRDMRENVLPILEAGGVDLVLAGHSHIYERSFLVDGAYDTPTTASGHILDSGDGVPGGNGAYVKPPGMDAHLGTVYVVTGHGGAGVGGVGNHPLMYFSEVAHGSCLFTVDGNTLSLRNVRHDAVVTDQVTIVKLGGPGDFDNDGDVDLDDFNQFELCFSGPGGGPIAPECTPGDFDADGDVDCLDWDAFQLAWTATGVPPSLAACLDGNVPTVSQWGLVAMALLTLTAGTLLYARRRSACPCPTGVQHPDCDRSKPRF